MLTWRFHVHSSNLVYSFLFVLMFRWSLLTHVLGFCYFDRDHEKKQLGRKVNFLLQLIVHHEWSQGGGSRQEARGRNCSRCSGGMLLRVLTSLLPMACLLTFLTSQDYVPRNDTTSCWLDPLKSVIKSRKCPDICLQAIWWRYFLGGRRLLHNSQER